MDEKEQRTKGNPPSYKSVSGGWVAWVNKDKNGNTYLSIQVEGIGKTNLFKYTPKPKQQPPTITNQEL